jgi:hypothetical protein
MTDGVMIGGKMTWRGCPPKTPIFQRSCRHRGEDGVWPKARSRRVSLWNEPWEGLSISGWGADMIRYRELFTRMAHGVEAARRTTRVDVLLAGAESSSNTFDSFSPTANGHFLPWLMPSRFTIRA